MTCNNVNWYTEKPINVVVSCIAIKYFIQLWLLVTTITTESRTSIHQSWHLHKVWKRKGTDFLKTCIISKSAILVFQRSEVESKIQGQQSLRDQQNFQGINFRESKLSLSYPTFDSQKLIFQQFGWGLRCCWTWIYLYLPVILKQICSRKILTTLDSGSSVSFVEVFI